jgi:four helix bundle protein
LGKKDFGMRIKICRKEAKESGLWLGLAECNEIEEKTKRDLISETRELIKIFSAIWEKTK